MPRAVALLLEVLYGKTFVCRLQFSFHVGKVIIFDSVANLIKKSTSRSGG